MRAPARLTLVLSLGLLAACGDPVLEQAARETRHDPVRADTMLALGFRPGTGQLDPAPMAELNAMVAAGRSARRDEFVVVIDGSGGPVQQMRAESVKRSLTAAGALWVSGTVEPAMAMGPDRVVVVRSQYRIGTRNCPDFSHPGIGNPTESSMPGFGCADAYNMGQMLARPRDAAIGRDPGPADATVNADAIQRYREGRVRFVGGQGSGGGTPTAGGGGPPGGGGGPPAGGGGATN